MTIDYDPTLAEIAGLALDPQHRPDGESIVPLLKQTGTLKRDALFWHYPHHQHYQQEGAMPYSAVRQGDYRLIEFFDDDHVELYDLKKDVGEQTDLSTSMPEKAKDLRARLHTWRKEVGAQLPMRNPNYDPSKPQHIPKPMPAAPAKA
jgi:arylsulfatase A